MDPRSTLGMLAAIEKLMEDQGNHALERLRKFLTASCGSILRAWLKYLDTNVDYRIDKLEFMEGMRQLNYPASEIPQLFCDIDVDRSEEITLDELDKDASVLWHKFRAWSVQTFYGVDDMILTLASDESHASFTQTFEISREHFRNGLQRLDWKEGDEDVLFDALNFDGDGFIKSHCLRWLGIELKRIRKKRMAKENAAKKKMPGVSWEALERQIRTRVVSPALMNWIQRVPSFELENRIQTGDVKVLKQAPMGLMQWLLGKSGGELGQWETDWTKVLCLAGGTAATAGLLWYLLHDDGEEGASPNGDGDGIFYHVCDPKGAFIGIRQGPDVNSPRTGMQLQPGEVFPVSEVVKTGEDQTYLKLADGRGWAFTHSSRDGRQLCERLSPEEARAKMQDMPRPGEMYAGVMERMMRERPELVQQLLSDPEMAAGLANPETMAKYSAMLEAALQQVPQGR